MSFGKIILLVVLLVVFREYAIGIGVMYLLFEVSHLIMNDLDD